MMTPLGTYRTFRPGQPWFDTDGVRIQAHGGSIYFEDNRFYWYGENKERTTPGSGYWHWGVRAYSSTDLYNWTNEGIIIPPDENDTGSPLHPAQHMDRPHIIRNAMTGKYVCWVKVMHEDGSQRTSVLTSDRFLGPYELARVDFQPLGMNAGDFDLVVDPRTNKAYYYFEKVHTELICAELTSDYTDVSGIFTSHFQQPGPPMTREAPAYFERNGLHYLITSGTTWYFPNRSESSFSDSYHGPFSPPLDAHPTDPQHISFESQISSIFRVPSKDDLYIALADRWLPEVPFDTYGVDADSSETLSDGNRKLAAAIAGENTAIAEYVWLPIRFEGNRPVIDWRDEWRLEDYD